MIEERYFLAARTKTFFLRYHCAKSRSEHVAVLTRLAPSRPHQFSQEFFFHDSLNVCCFDLSKVVLIFFLENEVSPLKSTLSAFSKDSFSIDLNEYFSLIFSGSPRVRNYFSLTSTQQSVLRLCFIVANFSFFQLGCSRSSCQGSTNLATQTVVGQRSGAHGEFLNFM